MKSRSFAAAVALLTLPLNAQAAELKVLASGGFSPAMKELVPQFEKQSGHKVALKLEQTGAIKRMIEGGEAFDVAIASPAVIDGLVKQGKIAAASKGDVARTGIGVAVKAGAPKPDIKSADALKKTLLGANSIVYPKEGASSVHLAKVFDKLGITEQLKPKIKLEPMTGRTAVAVAQGEAELGIAVIPQIISVPGVDLVGALPGELQAFVVYTGGVGAAAKEAAAAKAFLEFLKTPAALQVIKAKGLEPGTS